MEVKGKSLSLAELILAFGSLQEGLHNVSITLLTCHMESSQTTLGGMKACLRCTDYKYELINYHSASTQVMYKANLRCNKLCHCIHINYNHQILNFANLITECNRSIAFQ